MATPESPASESNLTVAEQLTKSLLRLVNPAAAEQQEAASVVQCEDNQYVMPEGFTETVIVTPVEADDNYGMPEEPVAVLAMSSMDDQAEQEPERLSYEQQKGEPNRCWAAFLIFRDMAAARSIREVARLTGRAFRLLCKWNSKFHWRDRAAAWDADREKEKKAVFLQEAKEMAARHLLGCEHAANLILERLTTMTMVDLGGIKFQDLMATFKNIAQLEMTVRGMPSEIIQQQQTGPGGGPVVVTRITETVVRTRDELMAAKKHPKGKQVLDC